jgi:translation initiation factor IF-1
MTDGSDKISNGTIKEALPNATFRVSMDDGSEFLGYLSGKMRIHRIKVMVGDRVSLKLSPYDKDKGRIVKRL